MGVSIRRLDEEGITAFMPGMREIDKVEARLLTGRTPEAAVRYQVEASERSYIAGNGPVLAIFGVQRLSVGSPRVLPWMAATDAVNGHKMEVARRARKILPHLLAGASEARGYVLERNTLAVLFLRFLGFTLDGPHVIRGADFLQFRMRARNVL